MRDIIRSGNMGRLAFIFFFLAMTVCGGQEPPPTQTAARADGARQETPGSSSPTPPAPDTVPQAVPAPPMKAPEVTPATPPGTTMEKPAQTPAASSQAIRKAKSSKNARDAESAPGEVTSTTVQETAYIIGPEDILYLNVLHQVDVSQQLMVRPDGFISVRFAGEIKAAGLTTQQLADIITEKLTQYFNHPEVNIQVLKINSKKYYVSGEVRRSGAYTLSTSKTIFEALIEAGGLADFAKKKGIYLLRGQQKIPFNYNDVSKGKNLKQNLLLQNGDVIVVP